MYLTRAFLAADSKEVRRDLKNPEELHRTIMKAFPDDSGPSSRAAHAILHRVDVDRERIVLLVQSRTAPTFDRWPDGYFTPVNQDFDLAFSNIGENPAVRDVSNERNAFACGRRLVFRLRANTTKRVDTKSAQDGTRRNGRRVPLRDPDDQTRWLERHAKNSGFDFDPRALRISSVPLQSGRKVTFEGALFEGVLTVNDADAFRTALASGIGPAKAYGFGLLSVAPAR